MKEVSKGYLFRRQTEKYNIGSLKIMYYGDKDLDERIRDICWFCREIGTGITWAFVDKEDKTITALTGNQMDILRTNMEEEDFEEWDIEEIDHNDLVDIVINGTM